MTNLVIAEFSESDAKKAATGAFLRLQVKLFLIPFFLMLLLILLSSTKVMVGVIAFSVSVGIFVALMISMLFIGLSFIVNMRSVMRGFKELPSKQVTYEITDAGCSISSTAWQGFLPWTSITRLLQHRGIWLLEVATGKPSKNAVPQFANLLKREKDVSIAQAKILNNRFPIFGLYSVPLNRMFLALPANNVSPEEISLIRERIAKSRG